MLRGSRAETKTHVSDIVTAADKAAEAHVVATLQRLRPDDAIVGEEGADVVGASRPHLGDRPRRRHLQLPPWPRLVVQRVALLDGDDVVLGAVHHPSLVETFVGGPGLPSTRAGSALAPLVDRPLAESCATTYLHPPFYDGEIGAAFQRAVSGVATLRMMGSGTMDAVAIAQGRCDVLFQHSVPDWDRLPGAAIIRGVGGESRVVHAAGVDWHVAGVPTAVAEVCAALTAR